mmetsp:Transcript_35001/g.79810  ORF Transcript_35001/g.79810 Transcript_35001/m.79810 type:complete len:291 (-) Transcript_35001:2697-3569(-)
MRDPNLVGQRSANTAYNSHAPSLLSQHCVQSAAVAALFLRGRLSGRKARVQLLGARFAERLCSRLVASWLRVRVVELVILHDAAGKVLQGRERSSLHVGDCTPHSSKFTAQGGDDHASVSGDLGAEGAALAGEDADGPHTWPRTCRRLERRVISLLQRSDSCQKCSAAVAITVSHPARRSVRGRSRGENLLAASKLRLEVATPSPQNVNLESVLSELCLPATNITPVCCGELRSDTHFHCAQFRFMLREHGLHGGVSVVLRTGCGRFLLVTLPRHSLELSVENACTGFGG